jgi:alpha-amylase/alpha-mannosidase (GH57 family)
MKYWSATLHFYQPPGQERDIVWNVYTFCYLPLLRMLDSRSGYGITLNISECLTDQLRIIDSSEFFELIDKLVANGRVELLSSAKYHPVLPLFSPQVLERQTKGNIQTCGFFPPELAVDAKTLDLLDYQFLLVDETALDIKTSVAKYKNKRLLVNSRQICDLFRSYPKNLEARMVSDLLKDGPNTSINDAELFGHHYTERLQVLADLIDTPDVKMLTASQYLDKFVDTAPVVTKINESTWQNCRAYALWNKNKLQKEYLELLKQNPTADKAHSSCYLYWLSNWPWWHPGLVQKGVENMIPSVVTQKFLENMWQYHLSGQVETNYQKFNSSGQKYLN